MTVQVYGHKNVQYKRDFLIQHYFNSSAAMDPAPCENAIYEEVKAEPINMGENKCYGQVSSKPKIENGGRECKKGQLLIILILFALLLFAIAGPCVAFSLEITKLKSDITALNGQIASSFQQLHSKIDMLYQQQNTSIDSAYQQLIQLNTSTQLLYNALEGPAGQYSFYPAASCAALPPYSPSDYYWVRVSNGSAVSVYCDITLSCGGVTGGWMRVAELDMTNSSYQCPSGLRQRNDYGKRTCVPNSDNATCSSVTFLVNALDYSKVCGRIIGYQYSSTNAFDGNRNTERNIDTYYVDGVSLTHGNPRQHIWTFAAAAGETDHSNFICPCTNTNTPSTAPPPEYVGNDYFCDTGSSTTYSDTFYSDDPLWDGAGCGPLSTCCSFNTPPWFYKQLPQHTTDDIEMRVCRDQVASNEDIALEMVDVFIQ